MSHWQSKTKIRPADRLFSEYIRKRDGDCTYKVKCYGHKDFADLTCSHFFGRARESTRFDPENSDAACRTCHQWTQDTSDGKVWLREFKLAQLGQKRFDLLTLRANTPGKRDDALMKLYCKQLLDELKKTAR